MSEGYAVVPRALFNEPWFKSLSDRAARLALYVAAGPHSNIIGAYSLPDGYIAADLEWSVETVRETVSELVAVGFVRRFGDGRYLLLCRHREWNTIANPNVFKAALKQLGALPGDPALSLVFDWMRPYADRFKKGLPNALETVRKRFDIPLPKPLANTETETSTEIAPSIESENQTVGEQKGGAETVDNSPQTLREVFGEKVSKLIDAVGGPLVFQRSFGRATARRGPPEKVVVPTRAEVEHIRGHFLLPLRGALGSAVLVTSSEDETKRAVSA